MPFTPSHVAAVLPLRRFRALPFAALAAGSMAPDLPYFVPGLRFVGAATHTLVGMLSLDVLLGVVLWAVWRSIAAPLHELSPAAVRERWDPPGWAVAGWWAVPVAAAVGAATHVGWDEFTHAGRYASTHLAVLSASYPGPFGPLAGYRYAQYASGAIGLAIIAFAAVRRERTPRRAGRGTALARALPWLCLAAAIVGAGVRIATAGGVGIAWDALVFAGTTGALGAAAATVLASCWWRALAPRVIGWLRAGSGTAG